MKHIFVIEAKFDKNEIGLADFWDLPFVSEYYEDIVEYRDLIIEKTKKVPNTPWKPEDFIIQKYIRKQEAEQ